MSYGNTQAHANSVRHEIEKRIITTAGNIIIDPEENCYNENRVQEFLSSWGDLLEFFRVNDETELNVEVVREYIDWLGRFSDKWHDKSLSHKCQEQSAEATAELEWYMNEIIKAVEIRLYPQGR